MPLHCQHVIATQASILDSFMSPVMPVLPEMQSASALMGAAADQ